MSTYREMSRDHSSGPRGGRSRPRSRGRGCNRSEHRNEANPSVAFLLQCIMSAFGTKRTSRQARSMLLLGVKRTLRGQVLMSASLIGRVGSSAFRLSATAVSMSLAGSCFSPDSALGPFHHGIRGQGGTNLLSGLSVKRTIGPSRHANSPHPSSREGTLFHRLVELEFPPIAFDAKRPLGRSSFSGPSEFSAINPDAMHNHG